MAPCVQLDELGVWATARIIADTTSELDLFLPAGSAVRRVDVGHGSDALSVLGRAPKRQILAAVDEALSRQLSLVLDPRTSKEPSPILGEDGWPRLPAVQALAAILGATSFDMAGYAVEFSIAAPKADRLALAAASVFGPSAVTPFRSAIGSPPMGGLLRVPDTPGLAAPVRRPSTDRIVRYVRTVAVVPKGRNTEAAQLERINRFLDSRGISTRRTIVDRSRSGLDVNREGLRQLLRLVDGGMVDVVVVASPDRLFRSSADLGSFLARLRSQGVVALCADGSKMGFALDIRT